MNPQTLNRYSYCLNNPLKYVDPSGHETQGDLNGDGELNVLDMIYADIHGGEDAAHWVAELLCGSSKHDSGSWYRDSQSTGLWYKNITNGVGTLMYINLRPDANFIPNTSKTGMALNTDLIDSVAIAQQSSVLPALQIVGGIIETAAGGIITFLGVLAFCVPGFQGPGFWTTVGGGALSTNGIQNIRAGIHAYDSSQGQAYSATSGLDIIYGGGTSLIKLFPSWACWGLQFNWATGKFEWK